MSENGTKDNNRNSDMFMLSYVRGDQETECVSLNLRIPRGGAHITEVLDLMRRYLVACGYEATNDLIAQMGETTEWRASDAYHHRSRNRG